MLNGVVKVPIAGCPGPSGGARSACPEGTCSLPFLVAGPENPLVEVATRSILTGTDGAFNPVVFYGPSGSGKSHLAHGLVAAWKSAHRRRPAALIDAVDFARQLAEAVETQAVQDFRDRYLRAELWIVEDLDRLAGKAAAQNELVQLLSDLSEGNRFVATALHAPGEIPGLSERLQSRLEAGLTVPLALPGLEARGVLIREIADRRGTPIEEDAADLLAARLPASAARLGGALMELGALAGEDRPIALKLVQRFLAGYRDSRSVQLRRIAALTARHFSVRIADLRSPSRRKAVVHARGVAMYLARMLTDESLNQIGKYFGKRDHTTVLHGCRRTEELVKTEPAVRLAVQKVRQGLLSGAQ